LSAEAKSAIEEQLYLTHPSPPLSHTHAYTHTHAHTRRHPHTHMRQTRKHKQVYPLRNRHTHTHTHRHIHTHMHTCSPLVSPCYRSAAANWGRLVIRRRSVGHEPH